MINKQIFRELLLKQKEQLSLKKDYIERELMNKIIDYLEDKRILIISGLRRAGKSTLVFEIINFLIKKKGSFCYVNFEDEKFLNFQAQDFEQLNEILIEIYGSSDYYFFDEIQNIEKFETFVRRLQDEGKKIIITGSNSSLLSKEFGTKLTGRYKMFELYPFSFLESLKYHLKVPEKTSFKTEDKAKLKELFRNYIKFGGIPEYLKNKDPDYIRTLYEDIIYRDIISRYSIKKQKVLRELVSILSGNISSTFTYNSLKENLKIANAITIKEYISYLNNSYLFFEVLKLDYSIKKQLNSPRKIYIVDPAFSEFKGFNFSMNLGKILENIVFVELKRRNKEIYYFSRKNECDFVIKEGNKILEVIQVCHQINDSNKEREIKGLIEAMREFKIKEGVILTFEDEDEFKYEEFKIKVKPVWKWLLEKDYGSK